MGRVLTFCLVKGERRQKKKDLDIGNGEKDRFLFIKVNFCIKFLYSRLLELKV